MGSARVVCLGEGLVDFVCERPVAALTEADCFVPHLGGSLPNIAVAAARHGADAELLGGVGDDAWGEWLRDRLAAEGVDVTRFELLAGAATSHAFVAVDRDREPSFAFYGDGLRPAAQAKKHIDSALSGTPGVLVAGSDTLLGADERAATMSAVALARERGWDVLCDPNVRPPRWHDEGVMLATVRALVAGATVTKCNEREALDLTGTDDVAAAGEALLALGCRAAVITRGSAGALLVHAQGHQDVEPVSAALIDATGAGDSVAGVLAAALAAGAAPAALAPAAAVAMRAAAGVVSAWGATAGLPPAAEARAALAGAAA